MLKQLLKLNAIKYITERDQFASRSPFIRANRVFTAAHSHTHTPSLKKVHIHSHRHTLTDTHIHTQRHTQTHSALGIEFTYAIINALLALSTNDDHS